MRLGRARTRSTGFGLLWAVLALAQLFDHSLIEPEHAEHGADVETVHSEASHPNDAPHFDPEIDHGPDHCRFCVHGSKTFGGSLGAADTAPMHDDAVAIVGHDVPESSALRLQPSRAPPA